MYAYWFWYVLEPTTSVTILDLVANSKVSYKMEEGAVLGSRSFEKLKFDDDEEEFRSCCEDEDELVEREVVAKEMSKDDLDEFSVKLVFKGISITEPGDSSSSGISGIGVYMERSACFPVIQLQKKLEFFVEESVADYLALMDGLAEAIQNNVRHVQAFTDSEILFDQITSDSILENPLLLALRQRILEHASTLDSFDLKYVPDIDLTRPLQLAKVAIGVISFPTTEDESVANCSICCEERLSPMMMTMKCSHKFCSNCMKTYVEEKLQSSQVPIRCPQLGCKYRISTSECRFFLPVTSYEIFERAHTNFTEANILGSDKFYCPYSNCSALLDRHECLSARASSSNHSDSSCLECPACQKLICVDCGVPWHSSMTCEEYQNLPLEERATGDVTLHRLAQNKRWRQCQQCQRMIELTHGCYHMTCWCGHEFCYSCGAEYGDSGQTCQCTFWDEEQYPGDVITHPSQEFEQWAWDSFGSLSTMVDAYSEQERSQLALIQRFLAGGLSSGEHQPNQSPPRCTDSYGDSLKDLHQLPWLERFVSVISDNFYDEHSSEATRFQ